MKKLIYFGVLTVIISACQVNPLYRPLEKSSAFDLVFFKTKDIKQTFTLKVTDKHLVNDMFVRYVTNEASTIKCNTNFDGEMVFKYRNQHLLKMPFNLDCSYVTFNIKGKKYQRKLTKEGAAFIKTARETRLIVQDN